MTTLTTTLTLTKNARHLTKDTQAIHRTIAYATGETNLWGLPDPHHLIIRHKTPINWNQAMPGIIKQAITTPTPTPITGTHINWGIIANPTKSTPQPHGKRGKITPLPPEKWNTWIDKKLHQAINIHTIDTCGLPTGIGHRHTQKVTHRKVLFTGTGTVKNQQTLNHLIETGIGRGKAYGCGLLLIEQK